MTKTTTKIKICGLTRPEDIAAANQTLPDYIGFVFAPSRRRINEQTAKALKEQLSTKIKAVGVFVNHDIKAITKLYKSGTIDLIQLHGDEDDEYIKTLKTHCDCPVIKAIGIGKTFPALPKNPQNIDYILFDTSSSSGERGGTGEVFDWNLLKKYNESPHNNPPFFLAGGLNAANITKAIQALNPFCIDISSGAETNGQKDANKIKELVRLVST
jgi:phosphoribosylanthranilate isomerase